MPKIKLGTRLKAQGALLTGSGGGVSPEANPVFVLDPAFAAAGGSVTGSFNNGETVTIAGSGFGTAPRAWNFDSVDNIAGYASVPNGQLAPTTPQGPYDENSNFLLANDDPRRPGSRHYKIVDRVTTYNTGHIGWPRALNAENRRDQKVLFGRYWIKPNQVLPEQDSIKLFRVWDDPNGYGTRLSWTLMHMTGANPASLWYGTYQQLTPDRYHLLELEVDGTNSPNGSVRAYIDGTLRISSDLFAMTDVKDTDGTPITLGLNFAHAMGWDAGSAYTVTSPPLLCSFADAWQATGRQRIILSESSDWNSRGWKNELQNLVSWIDGTIQFKTFLGQFTSAYGLYLFLVKADGTVIRLGQIGTPWYSQNFETDTAGMEYNTGYGAIVTHQPHSGSKSFRINLMGTRASDPITGLPGTSAAYNYTLRLAPPAMRNLPLLYMRWYMRLDHSYWYGTSPEGVEGVANPKLCYASDTTLGGVTSAAFYPVFAPNLRDSWKVSPNSTVFQWVGAPYGPIYGAIEAGGDTMNLDGQWNLLEMILDYKTAAQGYHILRLYLNGKKFKGTNYFLDGELKFTNTFKVDNFSFLHASNSTTALSVDYTGYACGIQFDDFEIWSFLPSRYANGRW